MSEPLSELGRLAASLRTLDSLGPDIGPGRLLLALGWATVDGERAARELSGLDVRPAGEEVALGARAWVARIGSVDIVLLEPSTEGRLAAALARRGEGLVALYLGAEQVEGALRPTALGRPGRLLPHARPWGPFVILVAAPE